MNTKETLKRLHETFPEFDTDTLLKILDCYVEELLSIYSKPLEIYNPYVNLKLIEN